MVFTNCWNDSYAERHYDISRFCDYRLPYLLEKRLHRDKG